MRIQRRPKTFGSKPHREQRVRKRAFSLAVCARAVLPFERETDICVHAFVLQFFLVVCLGVTSSSCSICVNAIPDDDTLCESGITPARHGKERLCASYLPT